MSIEAAPWKRLVKGALERMADEEYQRLAWFNKREEISSPDELTCAARRQACVILTLAS
jgi:hypothetical protein